jgi:hypothetical protein
MLDEDTGYKGYVPGTWPVTVKADVWSLGILAWRLVLPHVPGHDNSEDDNDARCESWKTGPSAKVLCVQAYSLPMLCSFQKSTTLASIA